jgi:uncharacterized membrane protein
MLPGDAQKIEVGRVVQRSFEVLGLQIGPYLLLGLLFSGIPTGYMEWLTLQAAAGTGTGLASSMHLAGVTWLLALLGGFFLQAVIVRSSILQLSGSDPDISGSFAAALRLILPMVGLAVCSGFLFIIGFLLLIVPGIIVYIALIVSVPVLVEEGGVFRSMRRSRELTRGSRGRIFLLLLLLVAAYMIAWGVTAAIGAAFGLEESALLQSLLQAGSAAMTTVLGSAVVSAIYFELRAIKDGATFQGLAEVFA